MRQISRASRAISIYGPEAYVSTKTTVWAAAEAGDGLSGLEEPGTRLERVALRNALRQMARQAEASGDERMQKHVGAWRGVFDKGEEADEAETA